MTDIESRLQEELEHAESFDPEDLAEILYEGVAEAADGCTVEPDGKCSHGYRSPLLVLGYI